MPEVEFKLDYDRLDGAIDRLLAAQVKAPTEPASDPAVLRAEYQVAVDVIKMLSDLRFRCLAFVTAITAVANAFVSNTSSESMRPALGVLGFMATLGIAVYELRNSQLYEAAIHRAKELEKGLRVPGSLSMRTHAGLFSERPTYLLKTEPSDSKNVMRFFGVQVQHDRGLGLIYSAALGAWTYLTVYGVLGLHAPSGWPTLPTGLIQLVSAVPATMVILCAIRQFAFHDDKRRKNPRDHNDPQLGTEKLLLHDQAQDGGAPAAAQ